MEPKKMNHDKRTVQRYVEKGLISQGEFDKYLKNLPDDAPLGQWVQVEEEETEFSESSDDSSESGA